jgi:histidine ammonia-lyase
VSERPVERRALRFLDRQRMPQAGCCRVKQRGTSMGIQHRVPAIAVFIALVPQAVPVAKAQEIELDGKALTFAQIIRVAAQDAPVKIADSAMVGMDQSFKVLIAAAEKGIAIYGLNYGVGENKDRPVIPAKLTSKDCDASRQFNRNNLLATSAGTGPEAPEAVVRAAMLIRLNTMLVGRTGAQPRVAELYKEFLNQKIHPVLPTAASVGEADIIILAHIGLAMMGQGDVIAADATGNRKRMSAADALKLKNITPLVPFAKDSLAIMSSNAYAAAVTVLTSDDADRLLKLWLRVFALSLEALNGNVSPFLPPVASASEIDSTRAWVADNVSKWLKGSFLWALDDAPLDKRRALQDPFSFRTAGHVFAAAFDANWRLSAYLGEWIYSSDDNPAVIVGIQPDDGATEQVKAYYVGPVDVTNPCDPKDQKPVKVSGAVIPTGNFAPHRWVLPLQATSVALSHVSRAAAARITRLGAPEFTKLTRFLTNPDNNAMLGYSAIQKTYAGLDAEIQALSEPVSTNAVPNAGDIEDLVTNSLLAAERLQHIVDDLYEIVAIELMHAAQGIDVRRRLTKKSLPLGAGSGNLFNDFRRSVPFLDRDRELTKDIATARSYVRMLATKF